ncbi:MAG: cellulose binding domain-containing protein, partial [Actinomycetes bacterium]
MTGRRRAWWLGGVGLACAGLTLGVLGTSPATAAAADVAVTWQVTQDWGSGFQASVAVKNNTAAAINPWAVDFSYKSQVSSLWDAAMTKTSTGFRVVGPSWAASLAPGATATFGLVGAPVSGSSLTPSACT